ncbi:hypothetical protein [uncultured Tateyamaria sp.]|uniref:hypothetical protein n=1 Tax=uncultured Tateyamaria sp. TaxID=455651 RepID=UPI00260186BB|nr:hypothetical protein [uncultured Tateyamaria sp.]
MQPPAIPPSVCTPRALWRWSGRAVVVCVMATLAACSVPKNVAVSNAPLAMGAVHQARLEAIYPVFVPGGLTRERYSQAAGSAGLAAAGVLFENDDNLFQISSLAGTAAAAVSGAYEERYNGGICQFFLRTEDPQLIALSQDVGRQDEDELSYLFRDELQRLSFEARELQSAFQSAMFEFQASSQMLQDYMTQSTATDMTPDSDLLRIELETQQRAAKAQLDALQKIIEKNEERIAFFRSRIESGQSTDPSVVAINNPCRHFEINEDILVVSLDRGREFTLQPSYQSARPTTP